MMRAKIALLVSCLFLVFACGCGAMNKVAKSAGAKAVDKTIALTDLGSNYAKLADTDFDIFGKNAGDKQVKVTYKSVGVDSIDNYNKDAETLYAQYLFADKTLDHVYSDLQAALGLDASKTFDEVVKAAQKKGNKDKISAVKNAENVKESVTIALESLADMPSRASSMVDTGKSVATKAPKEMAANPKTALLSDVALKQVKTSTGHCSDVVTGAPDLLKKLTSLKDVIF